MRQLCTANHFAWSGSPPPLASDSAARRPGAPAVTPGDEESGGGRSWRKREATLLAAALIAAFIVLIYETRLPPFTSSQTLSQNVVFFLLINLNIALILLVVFLLGRNIVKLVMERRQRVLIHGCTKLTRQAWPGPRTGTRVGVRTHLFTRSCPCPCAAASQ